MVKVVVAGASGSAGGKLLSELHPHLLTLTDRVVQDTTAQTLADHDVVFITLPHGCSAQVADPLRSEVLVVDYSADHRLSDPAAWAECYARHQRSNG